MGANTKITDAINLLKVTNFLSLTSSLPKFSSLCLSICLCILSFLISLSLSLLSLSLCIFYTYRQQCIICYIYYVLFGYMYCTYFIYHMNIFRQLTIKFGKVLPTKYVKSIIFFTFVQTTDKEVWEGVAKQSIIFSNSAKTTDNEV